MLLQRHVPVQLTEGEVHCDIMIFDWPALGDGSPLHLKDRNLVQALEPMVKIPDAIAMTLPLAVRSQQPEPSAVSPGPFIGVDLSRLLPEHRKIIQEASEDFLAVVEGRKPLHAKLDIDAPLPSDGGTTFYKGNGYNLTISASLSGFGGFSGVAYGPIIKFDDTFAPGNTNLISDIRVYSNDELRKLLK